MMDKNIDALCCLQSNITLLTCYILCPCGKSQCLTLAYVVHGNQTKGKHALFHVNNTSFFMGAKILVCVICLSRDQPHATINGHIKVGVCALCFMHNEQIRTLISTWLPVQVINKNGK